MSKLQLHRRLISLHHVCQNITPRHVPVSLLSHFSHVNYHLIFNSVFSDKERRSKTASIMFTSITANQKTEIKPDEIAGLQMTKRCFCFCFVPFSFSIKDLLYRPFFGKARQMWLLLNLASVKELAQDCSVFPKSRWRFEDAYENGLLFQNTSSSTHTHTHNQTLTHKSCRR